MSEQSGSNSLDAQLQGIAQVLRTRKLRLPLYQRPYSWGQEQVQTFWNDLRSAFLSKTSNYYLGTLLLAKGNGPREYEVVDGQQRLTTTSLILAALRDTFSERREFARANALANDFLTYTDLRNGETLPRLSLNSADDPVYRKIISGDNFGNTNLPPSAQRLVGAFNVLKENLSEELAKSEQDWREQVVAWTEFLELQVSVVVLDVSSTSNAFTIFETLNDRGLALSVADLLKNHIYSLAGESNKEAANYWEEMMATLGEVGDDQTILDYLRHFWSSWNGILRERDLYRGFRSQVTSRDSALDVAKYLAVESPSYLALVTGEHSLWPENSVSKVEAEMFQVLPIQSSRPLFLAAMWNFGPNDLSAAIRLIVGFWVRCEFSKRKSGLAFEKVLCSAAMRIRAGRIKNCLDLQAYLKDSYPSDNEFKSAILGSSPVPKRLRKYVLLALRNYAVSHNDHPSLVRLDEFAHANLVSLSPDNRNASYAETLLDESLANCKIEYRKGSLSAENAIDFFLPFADEVYGPSVRKILEHRQALIADAACEIWSIKD